MMHLKYMYNVLTTYKGGPVQVHDGFIRYYYKGEEEQLQLLIQKIKHSRKKKVQYFGSEGYIQQIHKAKEDKAHKQKGFWAKAKLVHAAKHPQLLALLESIS